MTITLTREEAQQVLDALEYGIDYVKSEETTNKQTYKGYEHLCPDDSYYIKFIDDAMETLRTRLAQPEPEPVACIVKGCENHQGEGGFVGALCNPCHAFITRNEGRYSQAYRNAQREWQGLTDKERNDCLVEADPCEALLDHEAHELMRTVEAKLKEKNT